MPRDLLSHAKVKIINGNAKSLNANLDSGSAFFFCGAGVSIGSHAPSVATVLHETASVFLPPNSLTPETDDIVWLDAKGSKCYGIQPEVFYENILEISGNPNCLAMWNCLSSDTLGRNGLKIAPNINHRFIVEYSAEHGLPIFTTNFDELFEAAAELNYEPVPILPFSDRQQEAIDGFRESSLDLSDRVYIFKLHGSISSMNSLHTTMSSISRVNLPVIEFIKELCALRHIVFAGYSGRDIDYFPELQRDFTGLLPPFWIDKFDEDGAEATKRNCARIGALPVNVYPNEIFEVRRVDLATPVPSFPIGAMDKVFAELASKIEAQVRFTEEERILLLAKSLHSISLHLKSQKLLEANSGRLRSGLPKESRAVYFLTSARVLDSISDYEMSEEHAKLAEQQSGSFLPYNPKEPDLLATTYALRARALYQIAMAKQMQLGPELRGEMYANQCVAFSASKWSWIKMLLRYLITLRIMEINIRQACRLARNRAAGNARNSATQIFMARQARLDHEVITIAMVIGALRVFGEQVVSLFRFPLLKWLDNLEKRCDDNGAYFTRGGVAKYKEDLTGSYTSSFAAGLYDLIGDNLNAALVLRNQAQDSFKQGFRDEARSQFQESYELAERCGSYATQLKALVGLYCCGVDDALNPDELNRLDQNIRGRGYKDYISSLQRSS